MSTVPPPPTLPPTYTPQGTPVPPSSDEPRHSSEIKLISHSNLFYWWPVWLVCFVMAAVTWMDGTRMAVVPSNTALEWQRDAEGNTINVATLTLPPKAQRTNSLDSASGVTEYNASHNDKYSPFGVRISERAWPGALFVVTLMITIFVTNVPLRGLLSFIVIMGIALIALIFALLDVWDRIFALLGNLHIHMNMAAYVTIGALVFGIWFVSTFIFDRRTYVIFTPGQIRLRDHIGDGIKAYPTMGASLEKQRNDIFRHIIFGLGSGDLIIHLSGRERQEIRLENVLFLGWRMPKVENVLRSLATAE
jgi:hypothetical protein